MVTVANLQCFYVGKYIKPVCTCNLNYKTKTRRLRFIYHGQWTLKLNLRCAMCAGMKSCSYVVPHVGSWIQ